MISHDDSIGPNVELTGDRRPQAGGDLPAWPAGRPVERRVGQRTLLEPRTDGTPRTAAGLKLKMNGAWRLRYHRPTPLA